MNAVTSAARVEFRLDKVARYLSVLRIKLLQSLLALQ